MHIAWQFGTGIDRLPVDIQCVAEDRGVMTWTGLASYFSHGPMYHHMICMEGLRCFFSFFLSVSWSFWRGSESFLVINFTFSLPTGCLIE